MKHLKKSEYIKLGAAFLLLLCFALPFSSCTRQFDEHGVEVSYSNKPVVKVVTTYNYPWKMIKLTDYNDYLFLLCFIWPVPILIHRYRSNHKRSLLVLWALEPILVCASSGYIYFLSTFFAQPAIGAYLMFMANMVYLTAWISEAVMRFRQRKK